MNIVKGNNQIIVSLQGEISAQNAPEIQKEITETIAANPGVPIQGYRI